MNSTPWCENLGVRANSRRDLPLAEKTVAFVGEGDVALVQDGPESGEGDLPGAGGVFVLEEGFDQDAVDAHVLPDLGQELVQLLLLLLVEQVFRVQELGHAVLLDLVGWVSLQAFGHEDSVHVAGESEVFYSLLVVVMVYVESFKGLCLVGHQFYSKSKSKIFSDFLFFEDFYLLQLVEGPQKFIDSDQPLSKGVEVL